MTVPVTTLKSIVLLAHKQYGIRFQLSQQQLVNFVNMIQFIAYNQDMAAFKSQDQVFFLGQDMYLETDSGTYTAPVSTDIGKVVTGSISGSLGTLMNYQTKNRINKWIIEPPNGGPNFSAVDGETLSIVSGTGVGKVVEGQSFAVSNGPYKLPNESTGAPPIRKFIAVTSLANSQPYPAAVAPDYNGPDDYGLLLDSPRGSRSANVTYVYDFTRQEITLVTATQMEIEQTTMAVGAGATTLNTSNLRWVYYINPSTVESIDDESKILIPERYRYEILYKGISKLADIATYGDKESIREIIIPLCDRFWEDMRTQYQAFGADSDWISQG